MKWKVSLLNAGTEGGSTSGTEGGPLTVLTEEERDGAKLVKTKDRKWRWTR